ncbi:MAG: TonB family protein [Polyangiales bacterium]
MRWHRWILASLLLHATAAGVAARRARGAGERRVEARLPAVEFDVEPRGAPARAPGAPALPRPERAALGGLRSAQNIDGESRGEGGDGRSAEGGLLLAARPEGVNLDPRVLNNLTARQEQRIRTAARRGSPQDDRRTPNPADDAWVATGAGEILFRLPSSERPPARGAATRAGEARPELQSAASGDGDARPETREASARPGAGIREGAAHGAPRAAGASRTLRPALLPGHASTTADNAAPRPDDDVDSALLAASMQRAFVSSTVHAGPRRGEGEGGVGGGGAPGSGGGVGRGGRAAPLGDGSGWVSLSSDDARYMRYLLEVRRRLEPLWADAFPRDEALRLRQGTVIVRFFIEAGGAVSGATIERRSGVDRFDANVLSAVRRARMPPIPAALGLRRLGVRAPFEFRNPLVR